MTNLRQTVLAYVSAAALLVAGCANQKEPVGGPPDLTPPAVLSTEPRNNDTFVSTQRLVVEFDKYVDQRTFQESIFISPTLGELEFDWSGKQVEISFTRPLRAGTTYVVNIGTDVADRRGNRLAQAYTLAFSTGASIDNGGIEGRVIPRLDEDAANGVMVFAYRLDGRNQDTLNPITVPPDIITQTGKEGVFALRHIALGSYRLVAVRDEYRNLLYDPEADDFGVPSGPIVLTPADTIVTGIVIQLSREDTTAPRLIRAEPKDRRHLAVQFSEPMSWNGLIPGAFDIRDTASQRPLEATSLFATAQPATSFTVLTAPQDSTAGYQVTVSGVRDTTGNAIASSASVLRFSGSAAPDTLRTKLLSFSIPDSAKGVERRPELRFRFSDVIARPVDPGLFVLRDAGKREIPLTFAWIDGASFVLRPVTPLSGPVWHSLTAKLGTLRDAAGRPVADSTRKYSFETLDPEMLGSIEGRVMGWKRSERRSRLFVMARPLGLKPLPRLTVEADATGAFFFPEVTDGKYLLQPFEDPDGDGTYSAGKPWPFTPSEPLGAISDTLKVRARWPLDGVALRMSGGRRGK